MIQVKLSDIPELEQAIISLGDTDIERAEALGISERTLRNWRLEAIPKTLTRFLLHPTLAAALANAATNRSSSKSS